MPCQALTNVRHPYNRHRQTPETTELASNRMQKVERHLTCVHTASFFLPFFRDKTIWRLVSMAIAFSSDTRLREDEAVPGTTRKQIGISIPVPARFHSFQKTEISHL